MTSACNRWSRRSAVAVLALLAWSGASCSSNLGEVELTGPDQTGQDQAGSDETGPDQTGSASAEGSTTSTGVLAAASSAPPAASTTQLVTTTLVPDCQGLAALAPGDRIFESDGTERRYRLALPIGYDGTRAAPMIVNFHGFDRSALKHDENTSMSRLAAQRGFVVVTPQASNEPALWNIRRDADLDDDYRFIHALVAELLTEVCVDPQRVYATGFANGSVFAGSVVCSNPREFAAVAMVAGTRLSLCPPEAQPSILAIAGTADESNPFEGDEDSGGSVVEIVGSWAEHNGCAVDPAVTVLKLGVDELRFSGCANDGAVVLMTIEGGTRQWPGTPSARASEQNSLASRNFAATSAILDFFESLDQGE